jgi:hypothetical protein
MGYAGSYKDVIYPGDKGSPPATHAIIRLVQCDPKNPPPTHLNTALDLLLNKIVDTEFKGVRVDRLHFVLERNRHFSSMHRIQRRGLS